MKDDSLRITVLKWLIRSMVIIIVVLSIYVAYRMAGQLRTTLFYFKLFQITYNTKVSVILQYSQIVIFMKFGLASGIAEAFLFQRRKQWRFVFAKQVLRIAKKIKTSAQTTLPLSYCQPFICSCWYYFYKIKRPVYLSKPLLYLFDQQPKPAQ